MAEDIKFDLDALFGHLRCSGNAPDLSDRAAAAQGHANALLDRKYEQESVWDAYTKVSTPLAELEAAYLGLLVWVDSKINSKIKDDRWTLLKFVWDRVPGDSFGWGPKAVLREHNTHDGVDAIHYVVLKHSANGFTEQANIDRIQKLGEIFLEFQPSERGNTATESEGHRIQTATITVGTSTVTLLDISVGREFGETLEHHVERLLESTRTEEIRSSAIEVGKSIANLYFQQSTSDQLESPQPLIGFVDSSQTWPRIQHAPKKELVELVSVAKEGSTPVPIRYVDGDAYLILHGDEWGNNFVAPSTSTGRLRPIDFEDFTVLNIDIQADASIRFVETQTVESASGDLADRIGNESPRLATFSCPGAVGRLCTALVQTASKNGLIHDPKAFRNFCFGLFGGVFDGIIEASKKAEEAQPQGPDKFELRGHWFAQTLVSMIDWATYWSTKPKTKYWKSNDFEEFLRHIEDAWRQSHQIINDEERDANAKLGGKDGSLFDEFAEMLEHDYDQFMPGELPQVKHQSKEKAIVIAIANHYRALSTSQTEAERLLLEAESKLEGVPPDSRFVRLIRNEISLLCLRNMSNEDRENTLECVAQDASNLSDEETFENDAALRGLLRRLYCWATILDIPSLYLNKTTVESDFEYTTRLRVFRDFLGYIFSYPNAPEVVYLFKVIQSTILRQIFDTEDRSVDRPPDYPSKILLLDEILRDLTDSPERQKLSTVTEFGVRCEAQLIEFEIDNLGWNPERKFDFETFLQNWHQAKKSIQQDSLRTFHLIKVLHSVIERHLLYNKLSDDESLRQLRDFLKLADGCITHWYDLDPVFGSVILYFNMGPPSLLLNQKKQGFGYGSPSPKDVDEHSARIKMLENILKSYNIYRDSDGKIFARDLSNGLVEPAILIWSVFTFGLPNVSINEVPTLNSVLSLFEPLDETSFTFPRDVRDAIRAWLRGDFDLVSAEELVQGKNDDDPWLLTAAVLRAFVLDDEKGGAVKRSGGQFEVTLRELEKFGHQNDIHRRW